MRSGPSLKLLAGMAIVLTSTLTVSAQQKTSDNSLSDTLAWMDNSYNPHPEVSGAYGPAQRDGMCLKPVDGLTRKFLPPAKPKRLHTMTAK
jgi:hypothetical protein